MTLTNAIAISTLFFIVILLLEVQERNLLIFELKLEWCNNDYFYCYIDDKLIPVSSVL